MKNATLVADTAKANTFTINDGTVEMKLFNKYSKTVTMPTELSGTFNVKGFITLYTSNGSTVIEFVPVEVKSTAATLTGDVNGDGVVNVTDVTSLVNVILGQANFSTSVCDLNSDGVVNVTDTSVLINMILESGK